jgi:ATP-dependent DNA helicase RecG
MDSMDKVGALRGVGPAKAAKLEKLGIVTLEDLLNHFPRDYQDRRNVLSLRDLPESGTVLTRGIVTEIRKGRAGYGRKPVLRVLVGDPESQNRTALMEAVFFHANYLERAFRIGGEYFFFGTLRPGRFQRQIVFPEFFPVDSREALEWAGKILPVYPGTAGLSQRELRKWTLGLLRAGAVPREYLPDALVETQHLCPLGYAYENIHFPVDRESLKAARFRLVFDELFLLQLGLGLLAARRRGRGAGVRLASDPAPLRARFPFRLTGAQERVLGEILQDLASGSRMNRLVQGDVGSGKTALAALALYQAAFSGMQGVLMAPTELLAAQHFRTLQDAFEGLARSDGTPITVGLLTGTTTAAARRRLLEDLAEGRIDVLTGTHALFQEDVRYENLALVVTDEQHRFGVFQRLSMAEKGENPHLLVMTATPIPRTLALAFFGDMSVSVLDEKPPGRQEILTRAVDGPRRDEVYETVGRELAAGRQAFVVAPLIEESETLDLRSAQDLAEELQARFPETAVGCLHGGLSQKAKDKRMADFAEGRTGLLVSTVVVEVGIDIPNATVMVIENAERFGLAQLHQLRGRVGRGAHRSYCFLVTGGGGETARERAKIMETSNDGFYIAEQDLLLRGPGEFFGARQHGLPPLKLADFGRHKAILEAAGREAARILGEDPSLAGHPALAEKAEELLRKGADL